MVQLDLTRAEIETLVGTLRHEISELKYEIENTDAEHFKEDLRARKAVLNKVLEALTLTRQTV